ncbi:MAG TPA: tryptophan synthase subunit alpha, partial [Holophaga sp.]|nr:tryptophan synthase subunit alpha [Holophaga sp.]
TALADCTLPFLRRARALAGVPLLAGFGVSTPAQAQAVVESCDGVIVGSALLRALAACASPGERTAAAGRFVASFREALDAAPVTA